MPVATSIISSDRRNPAKAAIRARPGRYLDYRGPLPLCERGSGPRSPELPSRPHQQSRQPQPERSAASTPAVKRGRSGPRAHTARKTGCGHHGPFGECSRQVFQRLASGQRAQFAGFGEGSHPGRVMVWPARTHRFAGRFGNVLQTRSGSRVAGRRRSRTGRHRAWGGR